MSAVEVKQAGPSISRVAAGAFGFSKIDRGHNQQMVGGVYQD